MYSVTCVGNRYFFDSFSSNILVFKLIILTFRYNNYLGCLDIFLIINFLYAVFKVHKDASAWKTIVCDELARLSIIAFSCIGMLCHD